MDTAQEILEIGPIKIDPKEAASSWIKTFNPAVSLSMQPEEDKEEILEIGPIKTEPVNPDQLSPFLNTDHPLSESGSHVISPNYKSSHELEMNKAWKEKNKTDVPWAIGNVREIIKHRYNNEGLTEKDIFDPVKGADLREVVYQFMENRWRDDYVKYLQRSKNLVTLASDPGFDRDFRKMPFEKVYEMYQNHQRNFSGGNTATTINELTYMLAADDPTRAALGAGYILHDSMQSIFSGERSEILDGLIDYGSAALLDPAIIFTIGLSKIAAPGISAASRKLALNKLKKAYAKNISIKKNIPVKEALGIANKKAATLLGTTSLLLPEIAVNSGVNVAYQNTNIRAGSQEEFDPNQLWFVAMSSLIVPGIYYGGKKIKGLRELKKNQDINFSMFHYRKYDSAFITGGKKRLEQAIKDTIESPKVMKNLLENFNLKFGTLSPKGKVVKGRIDDNKPANYFRSWEESKIVAGKRVAKRNEEYTNDEVLNLFFDFFWKGSKPDENGNQAVKGYYQILKEAGWTVHSSQFDGKGGTTNAFALAIDFIPPKVQRELIKEFENSTGLKFPSTFTKSGKQQSAVSLSAHFINQASQAGKSLGLRGYLSKIEQLGFLSDADKVKIITNQDLEKVLPPERLNFMIGIYKRLLTSHPATTGANIKGFAYTSAYNMLGDTALGAFDMGRSALSKVFDDSVEGQAAAAKYWREGFGTMTGTLNRGLDIFTPELPINFAKFIFELNPKAEKELFSTIGGSHNVRSAATAFNLEKVPTAAAWRTVDKATQFIQTVNMIKLQDEVTKLWTFGTEVNKLIRKKYGTDPVKFFDQPDVFQIVARKDFQDEIIAPALQRTRDATASNNWEMRAKTTKTVLAGVAGWFEKHTKGLVGIPIPFASFMNTAAKITGDLTGVNYIRRKIHRIAKKTGITNKTPDELINIGDPSDTELLTRAVAFYAYQGTKFIAGGSIDDLSAVGAGEEYIDHPIYRVKNGLTWNMQQNNDGSISERQYDFPESIVRIIDQMSAHKILEIRNKGSDSNKAFENFDFGNKNNLMKYINNIKNESQLSDDPNFLDNVNFEGIPARLWIDLGEQLGTSNIRSVKNITSESRFIIDMLEDDNYTTGGNLGFILQAAVDLSGRAASQLGAGGTRFLDPLNQTIKNYRGDEVVPDLNQGNRNLNYSLKYVDSIIKAFEDFSGTAILPEELREPFKKVSIWEEKTNDLGTLVFGTRSLKEPTLFLQLLNSAGIRAYAPKFLGAPSPDNIKVRGPGELTSALNDVLRNELNNQTQIFFDGEAKGININELSQKNKEKAIKIITSRARDNIMSTLKKSNSREDKNYLIVNDILGTTNAAFNQAVKELFPDKNINLRTKYDAIEEILTMFPILDEEELQSPFKTKGVTQLEALLEKIKTIEKQDSMLKRIKN